MKIEVKFELTVREGIPREHIDEWLNFWLKILSAKPGSISWKEK